MRLGLVVWLILAELMPASAAWAAGRVALVIGNGDYKPLGYLRNPPNDARAVADALSALGFDVVSGTNLDRAHMLGLFDQFARRAVGADATLFYYAGHGVEVGGQNYLMPIDAHPAKDWELPEQAIALQRVIENLEDVGVGTNLLFIDACRDNPWTPVLRSGRGGTRAVSVGRGLARMDAPPGMYIAFATKPGDTAEDGAGDHSPFTAALLGRISSSPGLGIGQVMMRVRQDVLLATHNAQQPWDETSLLQDFFMKPATLGPNVEVVTEDFYWQSIQNSQNPALFEEYLKRFPNGKYAEDARLRLGALREPQVAALPPVGAGPPASVSDPRSDGWLRRTPIRLRPQLRVSTSQAPQHEFGNWQPAGTLDPQWLQPPRGTVVARRWRLVDAESIRGEAVAGTVDGNDLAVAMIAVDLPAAVYGSGPLDTTGFEAATEQGARGWSYLTDAGASVIDGGAFTTRLFNGIGIRYSTLRLGPSQGGRVCAAFDGVRGWRWLGGYVCAPPGQAFSAAAVRALLGQLDFSG